MIASLDRVGMTAADVEQAAGLPGAFVSKLKAGRCGSARAAESLGKLRAFLEEKGALAPPTFATKPDPKAMARARASGAAGISEELARAVDSATSAKALGHALKLLASAVLSGEVDRFVAGSLEQILRERRQVLRVEEAERAAGASREPVTIKVVWVDEAGEPADYREEEAPAHA